MAVNQRVIRLPEAPPNWGVRAAVALVVTAALVFGATTVYRHLTQCADGVDKTDSGECVGVSDGSYAFPGLADISARIHQENRRIEASGERWVTVAYMESMSGGSQDRGLETTRQAVTGAHLAQLALNSDHDTLPRIRLLLVNTGKGDAHAEKAAATLIERRAEDRLVAVAGIGQSNAHTRNAVEKLRAAHIPTVGATVAADALASTPPEFFRVSFPARMQAAAAVRYLKQLQDKNPGYRVQEVRDWRKGDEYNSALDAGFDAAAGRAGLKVDDEVIPFRSDGDEGTGNALLGVANKICDAADPPDAVFFEGRGREIRRLIEAAGTGGRRCPITVLSGSSTVGVYFDTHSASASGGPPGPEIKELGKRWRDSGLRVHYTAYTHPEVPTRLYGKDGGPYTAFEDNYLRIHGGTPKDLSDGQAMLGHDAVYTVGTAARQALQTYGTDQVTAQTVRNQLGQINRGNPVRGVSGPIAFDQATGEPAGRPMALVELRAWDPAHPADKGGRHRFVKLLP
ncbi:ABC transporter substrate-binding protein [Streptomyces sp. NPDC000229]|uniref:ABC transporter substrate-binding protein n=1 Tax=Streptomyces sp. NPDC000229 TaxID=3154247 RepID=UPI0033278E90